MRGQRLFLTLVAVALAACPSFPEPVLREAGTETGADIQPGPDVPPIDAPLTDAIVDAPRDVVADSGDGGVRVDGAADAAVDADDADAPASD